MATTAKSSENFMRRAFGHMMEARSKQARMYVNSYLLSLDEETLKANGYSRKDLERQGTALAVL